jgi:hypothetical protein
MNYKCKYCNKTYVKETTLIAHVCENKRRFLNKDEKQNRIAYQSWVVYRNLSIKSKTQPSYEDFISNRYFTGFMKLAKRIIDLNMDRPEDFVRFIILNSIKMDDWAKDVVYETYVKDRTKNETVERAIERSLLQMKTWSERTGYDWQDYFIKASTIDAVQDIKMGRISPWCTFATDQGSKFIDRLEPGQVEDLIEYMNPKSWRVKVKRQKKDADWVQEVFNQAEIK